MRMQLQCMLACRGRSRRIALCLQTLFFLLFAIVAAAQITIAGEGQPHSSEQFLKEHHVSTAKPDIISALEAGDPEVRKVAAEVLSQRWPEDADSPLEAAMLQEIDADTRIFMAFDLATIGGRTGREMLITECHNDGQWASTRILAARSMTQLHDDSCVDSILETLRSDSDPQDTLAKVDALNLVPDFIDHSGEQEYRNILDLTMNALNDPDAGVRLTASVTLGRLGDVSAIAPLEAAITSEQDPNISDAMLHELKRLKDFEQSDPFRITINASTEQIVAGAETELQINVLNTSAKPMVARSGFQAYDGDPTYEYSCHDASGDSVSKEITMVGSAHDAPSIKPGETYTSTVHLNRVCDLSRPGQYEIRLTRGLPMGSHDHVVQSNAIEITIVP
jgi:HEAT repeats